MKPVRHVVRWAIVTLVLSTAFTREQTPQLTAPLNVYRYDTLMLVSDSGAGIRIYSVANIRTPRYMMTIPVNGNSGVAMKDSIVYANSYGSLVALKMSHDSLYEVVKIIKNDNRHYLGADYMYSDYSPGFVSCGGASAPVSADSRSAPGGSGQGGSYAIFAVIDSFLYYVDGDYVISLDISNPANPRELSRTSAGWTIETIFPTAEYLYVGGTDGMYVYSRSNPAAPAKVGQVQHFTSCDPVVVNDTIAYVTLRTDMRCGNRQSELMAVSVANPAKAYILSEQQLSTPFGLAAQDTFLLVARGSTGFTLFSTRDPRNITQITTWSQPPSRDFVWTGSILLLMGTDRIGFYDMTDPGNPVLISSVD